MFLDCVCVNTVYLLSMIVVYIQYMYIFITVLGIVSDKGIQEEVPPILQYQVLQLALDLPASKFSWFRIQVKFLYSCAYPSPFWITIYFQFMINIILNVVVFFCSQDVADPESSGEKSVLYLLLKMFVSSSSHLKNSTRLLILKVRQAFLFFHHVLVSHSGTYKKLKFLLKQCEHKHGCR